MNKAIFIFPFFCFLLSSCVQEQGAVDKLSYFQFTPENKLKLVKPDLIGTKLKYRNQLGLIREFTVYKSCIIKSSFGFSTFWGSSYSPYYYFDAQETEASFSDETVSISLRIYFQTTPQNSDYSSYPYKFKNPKFSGSLYFSIFNKNCSNTGTNIDCGYTNFDESYYLNSMIINGKEYRDVRVFNSGNNVAIPSVNPNVSYGYTVNKIYYSYDYCVIGYDEVDGTTWRIVN